MSGASCHSVGLSRFDLIVAAPEIASLAHIEFSSRLAPLPIQIRARLLWKVITLSFSGLMVYGTESARQKQSGWPPQQFKGARSMPLMSSPQKHCAVEGGGILLVILPPQSLLLPMRCSCRKSLRTMSPCRRALGTMSDDITVMVVRLPKP
eukprot:scaffold11069_cov36-Tisochrysis_lutea.AAC.1